MELLKNDSNKKLITFGLLLELLFLLFYSIKPLYNYFISSSSTPSNAYIYSASFVIIILLLALFLYICSAQLNNINIKIITVFLIIFSITLIFIKPIGSSDIYSYIYQARILSEYHSNPYLNTYDSFRNDTFYNQINNCWLAGTPKIGHVF